MKKKNCLSLLWCFDLSSLPTWTIFIFPLYSSQLSYQPLLLPIPNYLQDSPSPLIDRIPGP